MSYPSFSPTLLAEKIVLRDVNVGLDDATRLAVFDKIARLVQHDERIARISIELTRDSDAASDNGSSTASVTARGTLEMGSPSLLASVTSHDALAALDFLLDKFDRQLRRRPQARRLVA
jgi:ribosomal subunit interface protein